MIRSLRADRHFQGAVGKILRPIPGNVSGPANPPDLHGLPGAIRIALPRHLSLAASFTFQIDHWQLRTGSGSEFLGAWSSSPATAAVCSSASIFRRSTCSGARLQRQRRSDAQFNKTFSHALIASWRPIRFKRLAASCYLQLNRGSNRNYLSAKTNRRCTLARANFNFVPAKKFSPRLLQTHDRRIHRARARGRFKFAQVWTDEARWFGVFYFTVL